MNFSIINKKHRVLILICLILSLLNKQNLFACAPHTYTSELQYETRIQSILSEMEKLGVTVSKNSLKTKSDLDEIALEYLITLSNNMPKDAFLIYDKDFNLPKTSLPKPEEAEEILSKTLANKDSQTALIMCTVAYTFHSCPNLTRILHFCHDIDFFGADIIIQTHNLMNHYAYRPIPTTACYSIYKSFKDIDKPIDFSKLLVFIKIVFNEFSLNPYETDQVTQCIQALIAHMK